MEVGDALVKTPTAKGLRTGLGTDLRVECELTAELGTLHFYDGAEVVAEAFQFRLQSDGTVKWVGGQVQQEGRGLYAAFLGLTQPGGYLSRLGWGPSVIQGNAPEAAFYIETCFDVTERDDLGEPTLLVQNEQRAAEWLEAHA